MTYQDILRKFEAYKSDPIVSDAKLMFIKNGVHASFTVSGKHKMTRQICPCYIPTERGYVSSEWKKNPLSSMEFELTQDSYKRIAEYIQSEQPNYFTPAYARGVNVANVLADHLRNSDPYDRG